MESPRLLALDHGYCDGPDGIAQDTPPHSLRGTFLEGVLRRVLAASRMGTGLPNATDRLQKATLPI